MAWGLSQVRSNAERARLPMAAASAGFVPLVQLLLERGADMELRNKNQQSAWTLAAINNDREVVDLLRAKRAASGARAPQF